MSPRNSRRGGEAPDCVQHLYSLLVIRYSFRSSKQVISNIKYLIIALAFLIKHN